MMTPRDYAVNAAEALRGVFQGSPMGYEVAGVADVIEKAIKKAIKEATLERESTERQREAEVRAAVPQNAAIARLLELVASSPAVIYSYEAKGSFWPTFVGPNIKTLLGYEPDEYLAHPDYLSEVEAETVHLYEKGHHAVEYRFLRKDGSYCWVSDEWHLIRDERGQPVEVVGSWSDISARKQALERS